MTGERLIPWTDYPENDSPFEPWNDPARRDDPRAPWNDPSKRDNPFACWNNVFGHGRWRDEVDER